MINLPNGVTPRCQAARHQRQRQELPGPGCLTGKRHQCTNGRLDLPPRAALILCSASMSSAEVPFRQIAAPP